MQYWTLLESVDTSLLRKSKIHSIMPNQEQEAQTIGFVNATVPYGVGNEALVFQ
jgi:hypothetical protein